MKAQEAADVDPVLALDVGTLTAWCMACRWPSLIIPVLPSFCWFDIPFQSISKSVKASDFAQLPNFSIQKFLGNCRKLMYRKCCGFWGTTWYHCSIHSSGSKDFTVALPDGFPDHAHRGFVTLTYLLPSSPGDLSHEDFLGATASGEDWKSRKTRLKYTKKNT